MDEPLLAVRGLTVTRSGRPVLADLTFEARRHRLLAVLGPNGAGKSTLLKTLAGLLPYAGDIRIGGRDAGGIARRERAGFLAYVPQHSALDAALAAHDVVAQGRYAHADPLRGLTRSDQAAIDRALTLTDTARLRDRPFSRLSYGERRLVLLARALATGAELLLLDEPTAALDVGHALGLLRVLRNLADAGASVIVVLHQLAEAASACDDALLLSQGRCALFGPTADVIAPEPVRRVYGVDLVPGGAFGFRACQREADT